MRFRSLACLGIAASLLTVTGCADGGAPDGLEPTDLYQTPGSSPGDGAIEDDPFAQFVLTDEQEQIVTKARDLLAGACMAKAGFTYEPTSFPEFDEGASTFDLQWGPIDPESARRNGYTNPGPEIDDGPQEVTPPAGTADMKAYTDALAGTGSDDPGCMGEAILEINAPTRVPSDAEWEEYDRLLRSAIHDTHAESAVSTALEAWSACMGESGYDYRSPAEAMSDAWSEHVEDSEKETAFADATCKAEVGFMATWQAALRQNQKAVIGDNLPFFENMKEFELGRLSSAQSILGTSG